MKHFKYGSLFISLLAMYVSNAVYAQSEVDYANQYCDGSSYVKSVSLSSDDELWTEVRQYVDPDGIYYNPDFWLTMKTKDEINNPWPWKSDDDNKRGILFILPQGASYSGLQNLEYFKRDADKNRITPRIGLCSYNLGVNKQNAKLNLIGKQYIGRTDSTGKKYYEAPLRISQAQVEIYGVDIDADQVAPNNSAIKLENNAKLLLNHVNFYRNNNTLQSETIGLVTNYGSYISFMNSALTQKSNSGVMFHSEDSLHSGRSNTRCGDGSIVTVSENVYPFYSKSSELISEGCRYNSLASGDFTVKPTFFDDFYDVSASIKEMVSTYRYCINSKNPDHDYPPSGDAVCSETLKSYKKEANNIVLNDNIFSGYWKQIFRARWSLFPMVNINKFAVDADSNKLGGAEECADKDSFSIDSDVNFDGKLCVKKMQW